MNGVGTVIKLVLRRFGISANAGCGCTSLANEMDVVGPKNVRERIDHYTDLMYNSIKKWRQGEEKTIVPQPPKFVVKHFILWSCSQAEQSLQESQSAQDN